MTLTTSYEKKARSPPCPVLTIRSATTSGF
nr:MAG TPA: hypothetical protein [Caudoviricetes sp.]